MVGSLASTDHGPRFYFVARFTPLAIPPVAITL
jgi:hypothetical protein